MQLNLNRVAVSMLIAGVLTGCVISPSVAKPIAVEVWRGGDDGLTAQFGDALEAAFRAAPDFVYRAGKVPATLIVTIPTNLSWRPVRGGTEVTYSVKLSGTAVLLEVSSVGTCPEEHIEKCAAQVVKDAKRAAVRKVHD